MRAIAGKSISLYTAINTTAASTSLGKVFQKAGEKQQAKRQRDRGKHERERRSGSGLVVDCGLRQPARHGIAMTQRGGRRLAAPNPEKLLSQIEVVSMLRRKRARGRNTFDIGKQQASGGKRNDPLDVPEAKRRAFKRRQPAGIFPVVGTPRCGKPERRCYDNRQRHDGKRDRPSRQKAIAQQEQQDGRDAHGEYEEVCLAKLACPQRPLARRSYAHRRQCRTGLAAAS